MTTYTELKASLEFEFDTELAEEFRGYKIELEPTARKAWRYIAPQLPKEFREWEEWQRFEWIHLSALDYLSMFEPELGVMDSNSAKI